MSEANHKPFIPSWLDDAGLSQAEYRILCNLWRRADKNGIAWPSVDGKTEDGKPSETSIISVCRISRRTAWKIIARLIDLKLIEKLGKRKYQGNNCYRLLVPIDANEAPVDSPIDANEAPPTGANGTLQLTQTRPREGNPKKGIQRRVSKEEISLPFDSDAFKESWADWQQHRIEKRKPITPLSAKKSLSDLQKMGEARAIAAINHSIANGWQGIFEPSGQATSHSTPNHTPTRRKGEIERINS